MPSAAASAVFSGGGHQLALFLDPSPASHIRKAAKLPTAIGILLSCAKKSGVEKEPAGRFLPEEKSGRPLVPSQQAPGLIGRSHAGGAQVVLTAGVKRETSIAITAFSQKDGKYKQNPYSHLRSRTDILPR